MGKVLLAINDTEPDPNAFRYALELCQRMKADLKVIQPVGTQDFDGCFARLKQAAGKVRCYFENSMAAAAFAEAGEFESAKQLMNEMTRKMNPLLSLCAESGIRCDFVMCSGKSREVITDYVLKNKDILIVVYETAKNDETSKNERQIKKELQSLTNKLSIPVVVVP